MLSSARCNCLAVVVPVDFLARSEVINENFEIENKISSARQAFFLCLIPWSNIFNAFRRITQIWITFFESD